MYEPATITTIANGALTELFDQGLGRIIDNVEDLTCEAKVKRSLTIEVTFEPDATRQSIIVLATLKTKLASPAKHESMIFLVADNKTGEIKAVNQNPGQMDLLKDKNRITAPVEKAE